MGTRYTEEHEPSFSAVGPRPSGDAQGVLIVEDDLDIRETLGDVLREEGYDVQLARSGVDALAQLRDGERTPSVIILDLMMPVMDGWAFRAEQKRNPSWDEIPVIILSADANIGDKAALLGARAHLRKPVDIDELLASLQRICDDS